MKVERRKPDYVYVYVYIWYIGCKNKKNEFSEVFNNSIKTLYRNYNDVYGLILLILFLNCNLK
jgi:hypothetical protein